MAANLSWGAFGKATDLRSRIVFTIGLLIVYRLGTYIPVPGIDAAALAKFMDKASNGIMFAVIGFGGFLGIGEKYHAIPWSVLDYEKSRGGYVVPFTKEQLEAAPSHSIEELSGNDGQNARDAAFEYYKVEPYWN